MNNHKDEDQNQKALLICNHIKKLSKKQVIQILQNPAQVKCPTHEYKLSNETLCLHCNKVWCGNMSKQKCISTHQALAEGHIFSLNLQTGSVFCSQCQQAIGHQIQTNKNDNTNQQVKKLIRFYQFVKQTYSKLLIFYQSTKKPDLSIKYRGLQNLGNTCFLNTDLQVLNYSEKIVELYQTYAFSGGYSKSISTIKKSLPKEIEYFYDDVIEQGESKVWHVVAKKNHNKVHEMNQKLIKIITNCKFNELIKQFFEQIKLLDSQRPFEPSAILSYLSHIDQKYSLQQQQDAEQALLFIIDILVQGQLTTMGYDMERYHNVEKLIGRQKISPTQRLFGLYLVSQVFCQNCKKISYTFDLTYHLSIDIETKVEKSLESIKNHLTKDIEMKQKVYYKMLKYPMNSETPRVLPQFLYSFFQEQRLTQKQNYYSCSTCKSLVGLKKFYLVDLPQILLISIKRFNQKLVKNSRHVAFEQIIDLKDVSLVTVNQDGQIQPNNTHYKLYAVIVHLGETIHNGHYICFVRTNQNVWLRCSDNNIRKVTWNQVREQQAYVLLYDRLIQSK